jgi:hypothetical protein
VAEAHNQVNCVVEAMAVAQPAILVCFITMTLLHVRFSHFRGPRMPENGAFLFCLAFRRFFKT